VEVLITHPYMWPEVRRGAERYLGDLVRFLRADGYRVRVVTTASRPRPSADGIDYRGRAAARVLSRLGVDPVVALAPTMAWPLLRSRAPIVHALSVADGAAAVLIPRRGRAVVTTLMGIPERWYTERTRSGAIAWRLLMGRADEVICLSSHVREVLEAEYGRPGVVVPPGVDTERFRPLADRTDPPTLLFVAALDEARKRFDLLLRAFREVADARPDVRLVATGHGDPSAVHQARAALPEGVRERVRVVDLSTEALPRAYSEAAVTVLPSRNEAFGLTLAESLACGTPVVGTDDAGIVDVVDDPSIGRRFAPDDAPDLARALLEVLDLSADPATRDRCVASARRFDWATVVAPAIESIYRRVSA
jgi:glycosyltransferase involved in cell wall biosynthesis